jgi:hypothetical protein
LLRNKVEHRFEGAFRLAAAGYAQALLVNYEEELTNHFGDDESVGGELRFPVFLGTLTGIGARTGPPGQAGAASCGEELCKVSSGGGLIPAIANDQRFEFRITLVPVLGPKSQADIALRFIREDELTAEQMEQLASIQQER